MNVDFREIVSSKFEGMIRDGPTKRTPVGISKQDSLTVLTHRIGKPVPDGVRRDTVYHQPIRYQLEQFVQRFISDSNLPPSEFLDLVVREAVAGGNE